MPAPVIDDVLGIGQITEPVLVPATVAEATLEWLHKGIPRCHTLLDPEEHRLATQFRAVVTDTAPGATYRIGASERGVDVPVLQIEI